MKKYFINTKTELLHFKLTLTMVKLGMVGSRLVLIGLIFSNGILVDIQLVSLLLSNIRELNMKAKTRKF